MLRHSLTIQFMTMRMEINHSHGTLQQLRIGLWRGLTWKLPSLYRRIKAIKSELEVCCTTLIVHRMADGGVSARS
jgi:hypothetical protein